MSFVLVCFVTEQKNIPLYNNEIKLFFLISFFLLILTDDEIDWKIKP